MAKVVLSMDPSRTEVLERVDPERARKLHRESRHMMEPLVVDEAAPKSAPKAAPAPTPEGERPSTVLRIVPENVQPLSPAENVSEGEVRFQSAAPIEIDLTDVEVADRTESEVDFFLEEEPSAAQVALLPGLPLFAEVPQEALVEMAHAAELIELGDGETVIRTGGASDSLFAIVEGSVRVKIPGLPIGTPPVILAEGDVFGESCLLDDVTRGADVEVAGRLQALRIPKVTLDKLVTSHSKVGEVLFDLLTRRVIGNLLQTSPLFAAFDPQTRREVAKLFEARRAEEEQVLMEAGKRSDGLYILMAGRANLDKADAASIELRPVAVFGQQSLFSHEPLDFTVRTLSDVLVLRLPAMAFTQLVSMYPPILEQLAEMSARL